MTTKQSAAQQTRAYLAERTPGQELAVAAIAKQLGESVHRVSATLSPLIDAGFLERVKKGLVKITADTVKVKDFASGSKPKAHTKARKAIGVTVKTYARLLSRIERHVASNAKMLAMLRTPPRIAHETDLRKVPVRAMVKEINRRMSRG